MLKKLSTKKEKLLLVADLVERGLQGSDIGFDMSSMRRDQDCGTVACIGGHVVAYFEPEIFKSQSTYEISQTASRILNLSHEEHMELFYMWSGNFPMDDVTRQHAAAVIRYFAETGEIDWGIGQEKA